MKHKLSLFAVLLMALAIPQSVKAYDFSKAYQGQMLYYRVIDPVNHYVMLTHPKDTLSSNEQWSIMDSRIALWDDDVKPSGALVLPDTVTHNGITYFVRAIGAYTFANCPITSVVMSNTIDSLGTCAFIYCSSLTNVTFSNSLRYIGNTCFRGAYLGDLVLPASVRVIKEASLSGAHITSIVLNDSLEVLENWSLAMNQFSSLYIPASVRQIGTPCWYMGGSLTSIVVDANNPYFDSRDNCNAIISTANGGVIQVCNNTVLPEGITILYGDAFRGYSFNTLVVPSSVTRINIHEGQINKLVISSPQLEQLTLWNGVGTIQVILDTPPILPQNYGVLTNPIQVPCNALPNYLADAIWGTFPNYLDVFDYNVSVNGNEHGTVNVEGPTCNNLNAILTATPEVGYIFSQWSDGDTNNPRIVTITQDTTFTAEWQAIPYDDCFSKAYQGQMLYYRVIDPVNHYVMLTCPKDTLIYNGSWNGQVSLWNDNDRPYGALVLPDSVSYNGITYTVRAIGSNAFTSCLITSVVMPNTIDSLADAVFSNCTLLANVTFSNSLRYIGRSCFGGANLGDVVLPSSVRILNEYAFANANITSITLNNSLEKIGRACFENNLFTSLYIPASVYYLDHLCSGGNLTSIVVDTANQHYDSRDNCNAVIETATGKLLFGCNNSFVPAGVNEIRDWAFSNCYFDTLYVILPNPILINIGCGYSHIKNFVISAPLIRIHAYCWGRTSVDTIHIIDNTPPILLIDNDNETYPYQIPVSVPCNSIPAYQAASGWSNFTNYIEDGMQKVTAQQTEHGTVTVVRPTCANPSATFTATADEGYHFTQWSDGDTNNPRIVTVDSDTTLTATFVINQYTVNAIPNSPEMGTVSGSGMCDHGSTITLSATANSKYHFDHWSDNVTENPRTLTVTCDTTVTAYFVALPVDTLYIHDTTIITDTVIFRYYMYDTTIVNNYQYDTSIYNHFQYDTTLVFDTIIINIYNFDTSIYNTYQYDTIIVNNYYFDTVFVTNYYHDTIIVNNYIYDTIYLNRYIFDTIYIHDTVFVPSGQDGIDEVDAINAKIYQRDGQIVVEGAENNTVWLYDVNGRVLATKRDEYAPLHFDVPVSGTYMIKIGNHPARKVVVIR